MSARDDAARRLIDWHFWIEPDMVEIYRFRAPHEEEPNEPIKLLEVNAATVATGSVQPFAFTGEREIPFPSVVAEVTPWSRSARERIVQRVNELFSALVQG